MNKTRFSAAAVFLVSTFVLSGCSEDVDSEDIHTSGIYAEMEVVASSDTTANIEVGLKVGGSASNTYVNLTAGDTLTVTVNDGDQLTLNKTTDSIDSKKITYKNSYSVAGAGTQDSVYKISLNRTAPEVSALNSTVSMPAAPTNLNGNMASFSRSAGGLTLTWDAGSTTGLVLEWSGDCVQSGSVDLSANTSGSHLFGSNQIASTTEGASSSCVVTFDFRSRSVGTVSSEYDGGSIVAKQSRQLPVTSIP